jgi:hypothetical protein
MNGLVQSQCRSWVSPHSLLYVTWAHLGCSWATSTPRSPPRTSWAGSPPLRAFRGIPYALTVHINEGEDSINTDEA